MHVEVQISAVNRQADKHDCLTFEIAILTLFEFDEDGTVVGFLVLPQAELNSSHSFWVVWKWTPSGPTQSIELVLVLVPVVVCFVGVLVGREIIIVGDPIGGTVVTLLLLPASTPIL